MKYGKSFFGGSRMKSTRLATLCATLGAVAFFFTGAARAVDGTDSGANYTTATWTNGSTGGTGFGPWVLTGTVGSNLMITNGATRSGASNFSALTNASSANSFGLHQNGSASRAFTAALQANDQFKFSMGHKWDGGTRRFSLLSDTNEVFFFNIPNNTFTWTGGGSAPVISWNAGRSSGAVYDVTITKTAGGFDYAVVSPQASPTIIASGSVTTASAVNGFSLSISGGDGPGDGTFYFNNLSLSTLNLADSDNDGLPDTWETGYFGDLTQNGSGDPDADELTNAQEFVRQTNPTLADTDSDGLSDKVESGSGTFVSAADPGTSPILADTDGDGFNDGGEVAGTSAFGTVSNPLKKNYARITMPNNTLAPTWDAGGAIQMTRISEFVYRYSGLQLTPSFEFKLTAGTWSTNWGSSAGKAALGGGGNFVPGLSGSYDVTFNHDTLGVTFTPASFPDFPSFALAYGLLGSAQEDDDADGVLNEAEWLAVTDPVNPDSDGDGLADSADAAPTNAILAMDGVRDAAYTNRTGVLAGAPGVQSVQTTVAASASNNLANLSAFQIGGKLRLFIGGTPQNTQPTGSTAGDKYHYLVFLDTKSNGITQVQTNTSTTSNLGDASQINSLAGLKFDAGFAPDYCVKVTGGSQNAWINVHNLQTGGHYFVGESAKGVVSGDIVSGARSSFEATSSQPYADVSRGTELSLDLAAMGVDLASSTPGAVKILVILTSNPDLGATPPVNVSNGFDQVLPPVAAGSVSGDLKNIDFITIAGDQFLTLNPAPLPQISLTGLSVLHATDVAGLPDDPGAVSSPAAASTYAMAKSYLETVLPGTAVRVYYRVIDPTTGWFASVSRQLLLGTPQLNQAFIQYPTSPETIGTLQSYSYYIQAKGTAVTDDPGAPDPAVYPNFKAQLGYALAAGVTNKVFDATDWTWVDGVYNNRSNQADGRDEYRVPLVNIPPGDYRVVSRFTLDSTATTPVYVMGDVVSPGPLSGTNPNPSYGVLTVTGSQLSEAFIQYPTDPTTINQLQSYTYYIQTKGNGVTDYAGAPNPANFPNFKAQLGYALSSVAGSKAFDQADWTWVDGVYNDRPTATDGRDEYGVTLSGLIPGSYLVVSRFTLDNSVVSPIWVMGDLKNDASNYFGPMGVAPSYGQLTVNAPTVGYAKIVFPTTPAPFAAGDSLDVYLEFYSAGVTEAAGVPSWANVRAQLGYSSTGGDPAVGGAYTWLDGSFNVQNGNNDEYKATLSGLAAGTYYYACRFSVDAGSTWVYGGTGGIWNNDSATLVVNPATAPGSTFAGWAGSGTATNSELVGKYGIGGATNLSGASEKPVSAVDSNTLSLSAIVRTNDTNLTVVGEAGGTLTNWNTNGVSVTASTNTNGVPEGHQRQVFSVDRTNSPTRQFLRLKATLQP